MLPCRVKRVLRCLSVCVLVPAGTAAQSANATVGAEPPPPAETLKFSYSCYAEIYAPEWYCYTANLDIHAESTWINGASQWGCGDMNLSVGAQVPASEQDQIISCTIETPFAWNQDVVMQRGSGPNILNLLMSAFIPYEYIRVPFDPFDPDPNGTEIAEGDFRSFQLYGATARQTSAIDLKNPAYNTDSVQWGPEHGTGLSVEYDAGTSLSNPSGLQDLAPSGGWILQSARDDWTWGGDRKLYWGSATSQYMSCSQPERLGQAGGEGTARLRLYCEGHGHYPFHSLSPAIDWELTYTFTFGFNEVRYSITGCHDGFPAYEAYGNRVALMQDNDNGDPSSLFPACDKSVSKEGVIR